VRRVSQLLSALPFILHPLCRQHGLVPSLAPSWFAGQPGTERGGGWPARVTRTHDDPVSSLGEFSRIADYVLRNINNHVNINISVLSVSEHLCLITIYYVFVIY